MAEYTMDDVFEDVVLQIGDSRFRLRERTQSLGQKVEKLQTDLRAVQAAAKAAQEDEEAPDLPVAEALAPVFDLLDLLLEPLGDGNNGTRTHAKTILSKGFKNDEIGTDRIYALLNFCMDKSVERMDPTSRLASES